MDEPTPLASDAAEGSDDPSAASEATENFQATNNQPSYGQQVGHHNTFHQHFYSSTPTIHTQKRPKRLNKVQLILLVVAIIGGFGTSIIYFNVSFPKNPPSSHEPLIQQSTASFSESTISSILPTSIAYDFEGSQTGWDSDTQQYNAKLALTTEQAKTGHQSLKITTTFIGDATEAYQKLPDQKAKDFYSKTDAKVYFTQEPPAGFSASGPLNLKGKHISCMILLPQWLLSGGEKKMQIQLFVKDRFGGGFEPNAYSQPQLITSSNIPRWIRLPFTVGNEPNGQVDDGFDPTQVQAIGVLLTILHGSTINHRGSFYIDDCVL